MNGPAMGDTEALPVGSIGTRRIGVPRVRGEQGDGQSPKASAWRVRFTIAAAPKIDRLCATLQLRTASAYLVTREGHAVSRVLGTFGDLFSVHEARAGAQG